MSECKVYYSSYELPGEDYHFRIGNKVKWIVVKPVTINNKKLYVPAAGKEKFDYWVDFIDGFSEGHSLYMEGYVKDITALYTLRDYKKNIINEIGHIPYTKRYKVNNSRIDSDFQGGSLAGYIVTLEDYTVRVAIEDDVYYCYER